MKSVFTGAASLAIAAALAAMPVQAKDIGAGATLVAGAEPHHRERRRGPPLGAFDRGGRLSAVTGSQRDDFIHAERQEWGSLIRERRLKAD